MGPFPFLVRAVQQVLVLRRIPHRVRAVQHILVLRRIPYSALFPRCLIFEVFADLDQNSENYALELMPRTIMKLAHCDLPGPCARELFW